MPSNRERTHRKSTGIRKARAASIAVEPLEGRALLTVVYPVGISNPIATSPPPTPVAVVSRSAPLPRASGIVTESPRFYQDYAGPRLQELEAVKASGELSSNGGFTFTGTKMKSSRVQRLGPDMARSRSSRRGTPALYP
jgi:hypothetical protein